MADFILSAWLAPDLLETGGRWRHHRERDHTGSDLATFVVTSRAIGAWPVQTPIQYLIEDLFLRVLASQSTNLRVDSIKLDAEILGYGSTTGPEVGTRQSVFPLAGTLRREVAGSFTVSGWVVKGGIFALEAIMRGERTFGLYAFLI